MKKDVKIFLEHILQSIDLIEKYTKMYLRKSLLNLNKFKIQLFVE